jgi:para-nitrobenzyl esterase
LTLTKADDVIRGMIRPAVLLVVFGVVVAGLFGPASAFAQPSADTVTVAQGTLRGAVSAEQRKFLNIPFAAPPTGERRFRPPQPPASWSGVRDATREGNVCPQSAPIGTVSEDCLVLNVHTPPAAASRNLPVMVWMHGGGYQFGSGSMYTSTPLVTEGGVIVVTVNYRMGPFGFLALPELAAESRTAGNWGVLDQQAALRWVRGNIRAFGGDPGNVTIFGESAGGHSVCMNVISPRAAGLFHKAISQSGSCVDTALGPLPASTAYERGRTLASRLQCVQPAQVLSCLRGKSMNDLLAQSGGGFSGDPGWVPAIDGSVIRESTRQALSSGRYNRVPLISGTNKDEGRFFTALQYHLLQWRHATEADLQKELAFRNGGTATPELVAAYPPQSADNADLALSQVTTDGAFACPSLSFSRAASRSRQAVFAYELADPEPPLSTLDPFMPLGDFHGADLFYLFSGLLGFPVLLNEAQGSLSRQMAAYWTNFAETGDPNGAGVPVWPRFTASSEQMQRLTSAGTAPFSTFAEDHHCALWDQS